MRAIVNFFKRKWVIQLIGVLSLCALVWFLGPNIGFGDSEPVYYPLKSAQSRLIVILILVAVWGLNNLRVQASANRADRQMMMDLTAQPDSAATPGAVEEGEIGVIGKSFEEAVDILEKSYSKGKYDKHFLYEIPWYVIVGPPGSGKTTALMNSGLEFPLSDRFGTREFRGSGGTRNCEWLFTDEAVLIDTAGRYTTQEGHRDADQAEWHGFLKLLKTHRPRRPINGVLVTMSISDLMQETEEQRRLHAREIRKRIEELTEILGIRFPVYMLFTKCDLVAGFTEFFSNLSREERAQVWGKTFSEDLDRPVDIGENFESEYDELIKRLNDRVIKRMQDARDIKRRSLIFAFPQQMAMCKDIIMQFLQGTYGKTRFEASPLLRGIYFTSATQEGMPIDRLMATLANSFRIPVQSQGGSSGSGKSYFINGLLRGVIFSESTLAGADQRVELKRLWLQRGAYGGVIGLMIALIVLWSTSFTRNRLTMADQQEYIDQYRVAEQADPSGQDNLKSLLARLNATYQAREVFPEKTPWLMGFGLYQGDRLRSDANGAYERLLENYYLPVIQDDLEQRLRSTDYSKTDALYRLLKGYLMLGDQHQMDPDFAESLLSDEWEKHTRVPEIQEQLLTHTKSLLAVNFTPRSLDGDLIRKSQETLNRISPAEQVYARIKSNVSGYAGFGFRVSQVVGHYGDRVFQSEGDSLANLTVPGLFTYKGFHKFFQKEVDRLVMDTKKSDPVVGRHESMSRSEINQLEQALHTRYYDEYVRQWKALLNKITIKRSQNINQVLELLDHISKADSPMRKILEAVERNTLLTGSADDAISRLKEKTDTTAGSILDRMWGDDEAPDVIPRRQDEPGREVERHFDRLNSYLRGDDPPIGGINSKLDELHGFLSSIGNVSGGDASLKEAMGRMAGGGSGDVIGRLRSEWNAPEPLGRWLRSVSNESWRVILSDARGKLNEIWRSEVLPQYQRGLENRYPLFKNSTNEITLSDFGQFFGPDGVVDGFFNSYLKPFVVTGKKTWVARQVDQQSIGIPAAVLSQFQYAARIRDIFFRKGGDTPSVEFQLKPIQLDANVDMFTLNLDGQTSNYRHDPPVSKTYGWPGPDGSGTVRAVFRLHNDKLKSTREEGTWAWFRTLDKSLMEKTSLADRYQITLQNDGLSMRYELRAQSVVNPFNLPELKNFRCPKRL